MRAAVLAAHGDPPRLVRRPEPPPGAGEVLVGVTAAPVTPLDLLCAGGTSYFGAPALPYVPGVQGVGVVLEGPGALPGARVWFASSAGMAPGDGSLAERARCRVEDVVPLDPGCPDPLVAALGLSAVAAWEVLEGRAGLVPGETVLVLGAGGVVGQVAVQAARLLGAGRVVAAARSARARDAAVAAGADVVVPLTAGERAEELTEALGAACPGGVDVVVDPLAGVPGTAAAAVLSEGGRLVNLGSSAGPALSVGSAALRSHSAAVLGYTNAALSARRRAGVLATVLEHAAAGRLTVRHEVHPLTACAEAWARVADGSADGRVVLVP
ncbi:zinc-binding dehydrogenase [Phycicoccus endophyticus]|uniref:Zinc-binding dehydrogenase n=1 Tax=Phycicoccus endophyticus TaxID=1690220 RepID=A0A7G9R125_9MICO|nr:zinc-binding dehydrogenase [Phycicoccus endophyticus]NHI20572.1 zinc-binding dehydrogenase [Phycicoccus endophyticus]QNN49300.1 zinc-binding dehydrogenase [Phycicoccus endophyticus]GGL45005.1 NADPH:quinone reductase [Phycicoccus endophyticus]